MEGPPRGCYGFARGPSSEGIDLYSRAYSGGVALPKHPMDCGFQPPFLPSGKEDQATWLAYFRPIVSLMEAVGLAVPSLVYAGILP